MRIRQPRRGQTFATSVTARTGAAALPQGVGGRSVYEVEIRDAAFGQTLRRETRLHGSGDPLLSWEESGQGVVV